LRDLLARRRIEVRERVIEPCAMADADRECEQRVVDGVGHPAAELFRAVHVDCRNRQLEPPGFAWPVDDAVAGAISACVPVPKSGPARTDLQPIPWTSAHAVAAARAVRPETPILS